MQLTIHTVQLNGLNYLLTTNILCGWARHEGVLLGLCGVSANETYVTHVMALLRERADKT